MSESKHTPGPWKTIVKDGDGGFVIYPDDGPHVVLCSRGPWPQRIKESAANARLIAAAPDLLEALKEVVRLSDRRHDAWDAARAAIAKAEGEGGMNTEDILTDETETRETAAQEVIAYKGFDYNFCCRGFQYEIGKTYEHSGAVGVCESGFHACEYPLDIFQYYAPTDSRFAVVKQAGALSRHPDDTKIASAKITIQAELHLPELIARAVKWVFDHTKPEEGSQATGDRGAASATGNSGAASATGYSGAASATGDSGAASATGNSGAASATGYSGAASATGYSGAASATGKHGAAMSIGHNGRGLATAGNAMFLVYRNPKTDEILHAWAGIAGRDGIKPLTWYMLNADGKPVEVSD